MRDSIWLDPNPTQPASWLTRWLCLLGVHKWRMMIGPRRETGFVVLDPGLMPDYEIEAEHICSRCLKRKWVGGYSNGQLIMPDRSKERRHPANDWPIDEHGKQLPRAVKWNASGW